MDLCPSRGGNGPDADTDAKPTGRAAIVKADLLKSTVTGKDVPDLIHGRAPAEPAVDVIEDHRRVGLAMFAEVAVNRFAKALRATHQATPRTGRALALACNPFILLDRWLTGRALRCSGRQSASWPRPGIRPEPWARGLTWSSAHGEKRVGAGVARIDAKVGGMEALAMWCAHAGRI